MQLGMSPELIFEGKGEERGKGCCLWKFGRGRGGLVMLGGVGSVLDVF